MLEGLQYHWQILCNFFSLNLFEATVSITDETLNLLIGNSILILNKFSYIQDSFDKQQPQSCQNMSIYPSATGTSSWCTWTGCTSLQSLPSCTTTSPTSWPAAPDACSQASFWMLLWMSQSHFCMILILKSKKILFVTTTSETSTISSMDDLVRTCPTVC